MTPETCPACGDRVSPIDMHDLRVCPGCCPEALSERLSELAERAAALMRPDPFPLPAHQRDEVLALVLELTVLARRCALVGEAS